MKDGTAFRAHKILYLVWTCTLLLFFPLFFLKKKSHLVNKKPTWLRVCFQVRHAQGIHNVASQKDHDALLSNEFLDAPLSPLGSEQVINVFSWLSIINFVLEFHIFF